MVIIYIHIVRTKVKVVSAKETGFGQIVKRKRKERKMTQEELAEQLELSSGMTGQIERGDTYPSFEKLVKIVRILNIDPTEAMYGYTNASESAELETIIQQMTSGQRKLLLKIAKVLLQEDIN